MKLFNQKINNWICKEDILFFSKNDENHGIVKFYSQLFEKIHHTKYIDDFPKIQTLLEEAQIKVNPYNKNIPPLKKIIYYINFLKQENFLDIIPRLTIINNEIKCVDHLLINTCSNDTVLPTKDLMSQAINESVDKAKQIIESSYEIKTGFVNNLLTKQDPLYTLYLPYYFLMEKFRTEVDPPLHKEVYEFKTIRRDKQVFLNIVYKKLIELKLLHFDSRLKKVSKLSNFFHFAWANNDYYNNFFISHYVSCFKILLQDFLTNKKSNFYYKLFKNKNMNLLIEKINLDEDSTLSLKSIFNIVRIFLAKCENILLANSEKINSNIEYRFLRNILIELLFHNSIVHNLSRSTKEIIPENDIDSKIDDTHIPIITTHYIDRADKELTHKTQKLEDLKEILSNPANYQTLFTNNYLFEQAVQPYSEIMNKFKQYQKHFLLVFPEIGKLEKENQQLNIILKYFVETGLLVHIKLPRYECERENIEINWFAESCFWNNENQKKIAIEYFSDAFKFSENNDVKKINDEWLHYLKLSLKAANSRTKQNKLK